MNRAAHALVQSAAGIPDGDLDRIARGRKRCTRQKSMPTARTSYEIHKGTPGEGDWRPIPNTSVAASGCQLALTNEQAVWWPVDFRLSAIRVKLIELPRSCLMNCAAWPSIRLFSAAREKPEQNRTTKGSVRENSCQVSVGTTNEDCEGCWSCVTLLVPQIQWGV